MKKGKKVSNTKVKSILKKHIKLVIGFVIVISITTGVYGATILFDSDEVSYDNTTSGLESTNVQDALDELNTKAANAGVAIDPDTFRTNTAKNVYASSKGVCININNKLNCFKINNYDYEKEHIQQVFSDGICEANSYWFSCYSPTYKVYCSASINGADVECYDNSSSSHCAVSSEPDDLLDDEVTVYCD